jgi:hypothetical protein
MGNLDLVKGSGKAEVWIGNNLADFFVNLVMMGGN